MKAKFYFPLFLLILKGVIPMAQVQITGHISHLPDSAILSITYFNNSFEYEREVLGTVKPDKSGRFNLKLNIPHATVAELTVAEQYTMIYLVDGDSLYVTVDYDRFDSSILYTGLGAADNNYMAAEMIANFNLQAQRHRDFDDADLFAAFEDSLERENKAFFKLHNSPEFTPEFRRHIEAETKYRYIYPRWMYTIMFNPETNQIENRKVPEHYFDFLKKLNTDDQEAAENATYETAIANTYFSELYYDSIEKEIPDSLSGPDKSKLRLTKTYQLKKRLFKGKILDYQLTDYLKNSIIYGADLEFMKTLIDDYKSICKNPEYLTVIDRAYSKALELNTGQPAPDFTVTDMKGKKVSLSSFKGKVVYIDFWATWCAPCLAEMPHSHELMEKFKNKKDVVFLYVNVRDDKDNWIKYVKKNHMKGVVLYANEEESAALYKMYNFSGIPRYVLIDRNGKLIDANAERPGSAEQQIMKALE